MTGKNSYIMLGCGKSFYTRSGYPLNGIVLSTALSQPLKSCGGFMLKKCGKCKEEKSFDSFSKDKTKQYGLAGWCKECVKEFQSLDYIQEIKRAAQFKYSHTEKGRKTERRHSPKRIQRMRTLGRINIHYLTSKLERQSCSVCGKERAQAHHEDYSKPLDVIWLCPLHHSQRHKELRCQQKSMA
jgi:hypothetical protein